MGATATQSDWAVMLTNPPHDATTAPGTDMTGIGMQGTRTSSDAAPTGFTVDGTACP